MVNEEKRNPLVLNMASDQKPGGGWLKGASAQEESLFYRSTYALSLDPWYGYSNGYVYPLGNRRIVYSPLVHVFLDDAKHPFNVSCVAVPFVRKPALVHGRLQTRDAALTEEKIHAIVDLALLHGHDSLLLSAGGCGAFGNPPDHVAEIFERVLRERKCGLHVVFAILPVRDRRNFLAFQKRFQ